MTTKPKSPASSEKPGFFDEFGKTFVRIAARLFFMSYIYY
jgi:hypothetical protein